jgi:hypothetical protein
MMNQKEAVFQAVCNVTGFTGDGPVEITSEQRKQVNHILFVGFRNGQIQLDREFDDAGLKAYVSGLQSNWLRKDKRLNGNVDYVANNPGSRQGSGDSQLKALKQLLSTVSTTEEKQEIQTYIDARVAEIAKSKVVEIDFSALPADLAAKFKK